MNYAIDNDRDKINEKIKEINEKYNNNNEVDNVSPFSKNLCEKCNIKFDYNNYISPLLGENNEIGNNFPIKSNPVHRTIELYSY